MIHITKESKANYSVIKLSLRKPSLKKQSQTAILLVILMSLINSVCADEPVSDYKNRPLDVRVDRLERLMSSQKQLELLYRMKQLQQENQQLRNLMEEQNNELRILRQQQRDLYSDLNRRLSQMEGDSNTTSDTAKLSVQEAEQNPPAKKADLPVVTDKSSVIEARYGVTQREEIAVETKSKPEVATIKPMSEKERKAEQKMYQQAYDELRARQYNRARDSFIEFIQKYPGGRYAHIAQYWVAESSYAQRKYSQAIIDYQLLLDVYPFSPKKAEAELKKAYSYYELGNKDTARNTLNQLLINYPDTTEAGQAKRLLKQL